MKNLMTDPKLLALLDKAAKHTRTLAERFEQRVSWVMSGMPDGTDREMVIKTLHDV